MPRYDDEKLQVLFWERNQKQGDREETFREKSGNSIHKKRRNSVFRVGGALEKNHEQQDH
jgi:hypothetical protein